MPTHRFGSHVDVSKNASLTASDEGGMSTNAHLPFQFLPKENAKRFQVRPTAPCLFRLVIREKPQAIPFRGSKQDISTVHPTGQPLRGNACSIVIFWINMCCLFHPLAQQAQGILR